MKTARLPCGCRYEVGDIERWTELCPACREETDVIHFRAADEHRQQMQALHPDYRPRETTATVAA